MAAAQVLSYHGNCHCGRYRFDLSVPEIKSAISCTCSVCKKKDSLWLIPPADSYQVVRDDGHLTEYQSTSLRDKFCKFCGTQIFGEHMAGPLAGQFVVNARTIRDPYFNPFHIEQAITTVDTEDKRTVESVMGTLFGTPVQHIFACHCGQVQAELLVPIQGQEVKEDNCSSCVRIGYIGVYPTKDEVRIHGVEHGFEYLTGRKFGGAVYCRTCGVHVFSNIYGPPMNIFDKLPPERKERALKLYYKNIQLQPLNVRAMEGVEVSALEIKRTDEGTEGYTLDD